MVTVRYFAGARAAAGGTHSELSAGSTIDDLVRALADRHGAQLAAVLQAATFLVDGLTCHDSTAALPDGATIDILPPFAGG